MAVDVKDLMSKKARGDVEMANLLARYKRLRRLPKRHSKTARTPEQIRAWGERLVAAYNRGERPVREQR